MDAGVDQAILGDNGKGRGDVSFWEVTRVLDAVPVEIGLGGKGWVRKTCQAEEGGQGSKHCRSKGK
jgi:hypothetical protein